jgi:hypothetical protein
MLKFVVTAAILVGSVTAASAAEYFIVRGPDKKCKVVEKRPTEKTITVIGDRAYVTREEANKQVKLVCKER